MPFRNCHSLRKGSRCSCFWADAGRATLTARLTGLAPPHRVVAFLRLRLMARHMSVQSALRIISESGSSGWLSVISGDHGHAAYGIRLKDGGRMHMMEMMGRQVVRREGKS